MSVLVFRFATDLNVEMRFGTYSGRPLISEVVVERPAGEAVHRVRIEFDGAPDGHIALSSDGFQVVQQDGAGPKY